MRCVCCGVQHMWWWGAGTGLGSRPGFLLSPRSANLLQLASCNDHISHISFTLTESKHVCKTVISGKLNHRCAPNLSLPHSSRSMWAGFFYPAETWRQLPRWQKPSTRITQIISRFRANSSTVGNALNRSRGHIWIKRGSPSSRFPIDRLPIHHAGARSSPQRSARSQACPQFTSEQPTTATLNRLVLVASAQTAWTTVLLTNIFLPSSTTKATVSPVIEVIVIRHVRVCCPEKAVC